MQSLGGDGEAAHFVFFMQGFAGKAQGAGLLAHAAVQQRFRAQRPPSRPRGILR